MNEQPSALRFYAPDHPRLALTVKAKLEKRRSQLIDELMNASDWGDFNRRKGKVQGVDEALEACLDVERETSERNHAYPV